MSLNSVYVLKVLQNTLPLHNILSVCLPTEKTDQMPYSLDLCLLVLIIIAYGQLFFSIPTWLSAVISTLFGLLGFPLIFLGWLDYYWDSYMQPGKASLSVFVSGILLLISPLLVCIKPDKPKPNNDNKPDQALAEEQINNINSIG
jgi:hypothetical protein